MFVSLRSRCHVYRVWQVTGYRELFVISSVNADERPESTSTQDIIASAEYFAYSPYTSILAFQSNQEHLITSDITNVRIS